MTKTRAVPGRVVNSELPDHTTTSVHQLTTHDGALVHGVLHKVPNCRTVVCLAHPRQDLTHHPIIAGLLARGYAVWTQGTRSMNNDIALVHEQALLDLAAGQVFLRSIGFDQVVTLGHSGGGALSAYYHEQASHSSHDRVQLTPAGRETQLATAEMPTPDAAIFLAPHPGQGELLMKMIDPSVADESDPLSVLSELDPYSATNGFADAPQSSSYSEEFVLRYRKAQHERIKRIDDAARRYAAEAQVARDLGFDAVHRRQAVAPRLLIVYRTDADLRCTDLSLDSNDRLYGSLFGRRPDLTNYGLNGFGRITTPDAWLSTWSGLTSNAGFVRCAPRIKVPSLFIELTGDQACTPTDAATMFNALGAPDKTHRRLPGTHFGAALRPDNPTGIALATEEIDRWLAERFA
ncbi:alpha/beta hydrolase [Rhodococcus erythropolis]|uniref:alpha/beta hydrolase n=1 Tax=Rhodococcus erythropolis TaxID=1833 RepID=UPI000878F29F|nr:alpha/beta hydrolase [Rhodococcus erythropolis]OFV75269.1 alpha/beta hydrolase family protein [Rhodococcus erythropolis]